MRPTALPRDAPIAMVGKKIPAGTWERTSIIRNHFTDLKARTHTIIPKVQAVKPILTTAVNTNRKIFSNNADGLVWCHTSDSRNEDEATRTYLHKPWKSPRAGSHSWKSCATSSDDCTLCERPHLDILVTHSRRSRHSHIWPYLRNTTYCSEGSR